MLSPRDFVSSQRDCLVIANAPESFRRRHNNHFTCFACYNRTTRTYINHHDDLDFGVSNSTAILPSLIQLCYTTLDKDSDICFCNHTMPYTVLISGANKGLGLSLLEKYLSRPDTTAIATVRDPSSKEAKALHDIPRASGTNLIIVKVESRSDTDCLSAMSTLKNQGVTHLDVVIANAGYYNVPAEPQVAKISSQLLLEHFDVNTAGPIRLFQAALPLLHKAEKPVFMYMSSMAGSIAATGEVPFPVGVYGASKAASNFLVRRAHQENPDLIIFSMHPGFVSLCFFDKNVVADSGQCCEDAWRCTGH